MTKLALLTAALLAGVSLAGCAQNERAAPTSGTSSTRPMAAPTTPQPMPAPGTTGQPMSSTYGSGTSVPPVDVATQQEIRDRMADDGYNEVTNLQRDAGGYTATAVKDGKVVQVMIDATGKVTRIH
jgi:hypothetical protein